MIKLDEIILKSLLRKIEVGNYELHGLQHILYSRTYRILLILHVLWNI